MTKYNNTTPTSNTLWNDSNKPIAYAELIKEASIEWNIIDPLPENNENELEGEPFNSILPQLVAGATFRGGEPTLSALNTFFLQNYIELHNTNANKADINSPEFTGTPTAPTAVVGTDSAQIATTEFVNKAVDIATAKVIKQCVLPMPVERYWSEVSYDKNTPSLIGSYLVENQDDAHYNSIKINVEEYKGQTLLVFPYALLNELLINNCLENLLIRNNIIPTEIVWGGAINLEDINVQLGDTNSLLDLYQYLANPFTVKLYGSRMFYSIQGFNNVRDFGGLIGAGNKPVRFGKLIRGALPSNYKHEETFPVDYDRPLHTAFFTAVSFVLNLEYGDTITIGSLGNRLNIIDFTGNQYPGYGISSNYSLIPKFIQGENTSEMALLRKAICDVVNGIVSETDAFNPLVYFISCAWGAHRTGVASSLLQGLLGVSDSDIEKDFELTSFDLNYLTDILSKDNNEHHQKDAFQAARNYGGWYRLAMDFTGLTYDTVESFREIILKDYRKSSNLEGNIINEGDTLYQRKNGTLYPLVHPDLSTQPSILPYCFGNLDIKEVLVKRTVVEPQYFEGYFCTIMDTTPPQSFNTLIDYTSYPRDLVSNCRTYIYNSEYIVFGDNGTNSYPASLCNILVGNNWFYIPPTASYMWGSLRYKLIYPMYDKTLGFPYFKYFLLRDSGGSSVYNVVNGTSFGECTLEEALNGNATNPYSKILDPEIPSSATIISASSFNSDACVPAICKKVDGEWTITNNENIEPDFTLIKYYESSENTYYYQPVQEETARQIISVVTKSSGAHSFPYCTCEDIYGTENPSINVDDIIGTATIGSTETPLIASSLSYYITLRSDVLENSTIKMNRSASELTTLSNDTLDSETIVLKFYAL